MEKERRDELVEGIEGWKRHVLATHPEIDPDDLLVNPVHIGIVGGVESATTDETWIAAASIAIKTMGPDRFLRKMIDGLRRSFGGKAKVPRPHKNDFCPCGSTRKYGKCCGKLVEEGDPDQCATEGHAWRPWDKIEATGAYIRGCFRCTGIESAIAPREVELGGTKIVGFGCRRCGAKPSDQELGAALEAAKADYSCAACGRHLSITEIIVEHDEKDGRCAGWAHTSLEGPDVAVALQDDDGFLGSLHRTCFTKALPHWGKLAGEEGATPAATKVRRGGKK